MGGAHLCWNKALLDMAGGIDDAEQCCVDGEQHGSRVSMPKACRRWLLVMALLCAWAGRMRRRVGVGGCWETRWLAAQRMGAAQHAGSMQRSNTGAGSATHGRRSARGQHATQQHRRWQPGVGRSVQPWRAWHMHGHGMGGADLNVGWNIQTECGIQLSASGTRWNLISGGKQVSCVHGTWWQLAAVSGGYQKLLK